MQILHDVRIIIFDNAAEASASVLPLSDTDLAFIAGDITSLKKGVGAKNVLAGTIGNTYANTPGISTAAGLIKNPFSSAAVNVTATVTVAQLLTKYLTSTSAAAVSATLPTALQVAQALAAATSVSSIVEGTEFEFAVDNIPGANTVTVVVGTNITAATPALTGGAALTVGAGFFGKFLIKFTAVTVVSGAITAATALIYRSL